MMPTSLQQSRLESTLTPGSDAVLHMSRIEFELTETDPN